MVRSSKWIKGAKPEKPVTEVAERSLRARLDMVWHYAPLAAQKADKDIEYVHQLRVSVRRAKAALGLYAELLPRKKVKSINKTLRDLRKAAGDARDLDVLAARLAGIANQNKQVHLGAVMKNIAVRRKKAQKPLIRSYVKAKEIGSKRRSRRLVSELRWTSPQPEPLFAEFARATFKPMVDAFFDSARQDLSDVKALHQMRIEGKQVRYGMELLAGAFDKSFRDELYPIFGEVQEQIGTINDHATAIALLNHWIECADHNGSQTALGELIVNETMQLEEARRGFLNWWTPARAALLAERFEAALGSGEQIRPCVDRNVEDSSKSIIPVG